MSGGSRVATRLRLRTRRPKTAARHRLERILPLYVRGWRDARRGSRALLGPGTRLAILQDTPVWMGGLGATIGERNSDGSARLVLTGEQGRDRFLHPLTPPRTGAVRTALAKGVLTLRGHPRSPFGRFTPKQGLSPMKLIPRNAFVGGFAVFWMSFGGEAKQTKLLLFVFFACLSYFFRQ